MKHITLPVLDDSGQRVMTREVLEVELVVDGLQLLHSPAFVEGLAGGDVIREDVTSLTGFCLVRRARNLAVVAFFPSPQVRSSARPALESALHPLGGVCDGGPGNALVFTVPVSAGFPAVERVFEEAKARYSGTTWCFNNVYGPDARPLEWWK